MASAQDRKTAAYASAIGRHHQNSAGQEWVSAKLRPVGPVAR